jgi:hypothetical protein
MVPLRNWEPLVNVHARLCCLAHAGIEVSSHDPLWNYTDLLSSVNYFLEIISVLFVKVIKQHLSSLLDQTDIPLSCVVSFLLILVVTTHTSSLYILCVKVKPWSFLVSRDNWLALKIEICFPCYWNAGVCSFSLLFNPCIPKPSGQFISHEKTDEQRDQMDFYPNAWSTVNKSELSTVGLPVDNKRTYPLSKIVQQVGFTNL